MKRRILILLAAGMTFISISVPIGVNIWYTNQVVSHECGALTLLTAIPAPKPSDPKANPSREENYLFHNALVRWAHGDGCE